MAEPPTDRASEGTNELFVAIYEQLRGLARGLLARERPGHSLQPTALVHEAYARLVAADSLRWGSKTHFLAIASRQMRRILIDHARAAGRAKRGDRPIKVTLNPDVAVAPEHAIDAIALDEALTALERRSERQSRVVEMRLFAGMEVRDVAQALEVSERTVKQDWRVARAWLSGRLKSAAAAS